MKNVNGDWIRELRVDLDLTQAEFAGRLNVSQGTVANWENDKRYPVGPAIIVLEFLDLERRRLIPEKIPA